MVGPGVTDDQKTGLTEGGLDLIGEGSGGEPASQEDLLPGLLEVDDVDPVILLLEDVLLHGLLAVVRANVGGCSQHLGDIILGNSKACKSSRHFVSRFFIQSYGKIRVFNATWSAGEPH